MIKADHKRWARFVFSLYITGQLKKHFAHFYILNEVPEDNPSASVILCPNHFSWWDGFLIDFICRKFFPGKLFHIMMLEDQLKRYWFFQKLGAYSINPDNPRSIVSTINYTHLLTKKENSFIAIYPQGEYQPVDAAKITLREGLRKFIGTAPRGVRVIPIAFNFRHTDEKLPSVYCRFGTPLHPADIEKDFTLFESAFRENISLLLSESGSVKPAKDLFTNG